MMLVENYASTYTLAWGSIEAGSDRNNSIVCFNTVEGTDSYTSYLLPGLSAKSDRVNSS
ncbi:MAG: hypothetical protein ACRC62_32840 [Microcoleus sp.]